MVLGAIVGVSGKSGSEAEINQCLPDAWKVADTSSTDPAGESNGGSHSTLDTVLKGISDAIGIGCKIKDQFKGLFGKKMFLHSKKLFLQKMERYAKKRRWNVGVIAKSAVEAAKKVGGAVVNAAKAVGGGVKELVQKAKELFNSIKAKITAILNSDTVKNILHIVDCLKQLGTAGKGIYDVVKGIYEKVTTIISGGALGLAKVFVDIICNFETFKKAVQTLIQGIKESDKLKKLKLYGEFIGLLIRGIGSKRFLKMQYYLVKFN